MADPTPQNFANHTRFDPPFHFFILPVLALGWLVSVYWLVRRPGLHPVAVVVFLAAVVGGIVMGRLYAIKVQTRIIRLEERLRLALLLPENLRSQLMKLSESQLVGLRFASDAEVPALAQRALTENLPNKEIKQAVKNWRPDYWRV